MLFLLIFVGILFWVGLTIARTIARAVTGGKKPQMLETGSRSASPIRSSFGANTAGIKSSRSTNWQTVPEGQRGVCFFTGRPYPLSELTPVTVNVNGMPRRVLASPEAMDELNAGREPHVMAFFVQDHYVPWFAYPDYNPYALTGMAGDYVTGADYPPMSGIETPYWDAPPVDNNGDWGGDYTMTPESPAYQDFAMEAASQPPENTFAPTNENDGFTLDPSYVERDALPDPDPQPEPDVTDDFVQLANTGGDLTQYDNSAMESGDNEVAGSDAS